MSAGDPIDLILDFVEEAHEHLAGVQGTLMDMEVRRVAGDAVDLDQVNTVFRAFHSVKGTAGFLDLDHVVSVTHEAETLLARVRQGLAELTGDHVTVLCSALDFTAAALAELERTGTDAALGAVAAETVQYIASCTRVQAEGELAPPIGESDPTDVFPLDDQEEAPVEAMGARVSPVAPTPSEAAAEPALPSRSAEPPRPPETPERGGSVRVDVEKLDVLMNLVGELILAEVMVTHNEDLDGLELESFAKAARDLNRITRALQDIAMSVRMVPVGATFRKMHRLVRDLSLETGKRVELVLRGEHTEVDKNLVERITGPLVHMIRDALCDGIESPAERLAAGKPEDGTIVLEALHQSGEVWISIQDDGRGLDKVRISGTGEPSDEAEADVDVARRSIEAISGRIDVTSTPGLGTTITIKIPLTLAIIDGMLVRVGEQVYTLPLLNIMESLRGRSTHLTPLPDGREMVNIRGQILPLIRLGEVFGRRGPSTAIEEGILVVCSHGGRRVCLLVDELLGQRQTVIKGLPDYLGARGGFSGCSILSSGNISLIVDLGALKPMVRAAHAA